MYVSTGLCRKAYACVSVRVTWAKTLSSPGWGLSVTVEVFCVFQEAKEERGE